MKYSVNAFFKIFISSHTHMNNYILLYVYKKTEMCYRFICLNNIKAKCCRNTHTHTHNTSKRSVEQTITEWNESKEKKTIIKIKIYISFKIWCSAIAIVIVIWDVCIVNSHFNFKWQTNNTQKKQQKVREKEKWKKLLEMKKVFFVGQLRKLHSSR